MRATSVALLVACACGGTPLPADEPGPILAGRADREAGPAPLRVCFDATASPGSDGRPPALTWDFGDGSPRAAGPDTCHAYAEPGSYAASVEREGLDGGSAMSVVVVTATGP